MKKGILLAGGIILIVAVVSPYFCGNSVEDKFDSKVVELQNAVKSKPNIVLKKTDYSKGWFSSSAKTELMINGHPLVMDHKIVHGPWGYLGLGKVKTTFEINDNLKPDVEKLFAGNDPLIITTKLGFSGYDSVEVYSPPIAKQPLPSTPDTNITWGGMKGEFKFVGDRVISDLSIPELVLEQADESLLIQHAKLAGEGIYQFDNLPAVISKNWTGSLALTIDKLAANNSNGEFSAALNLVLNTIDADDGTVAYDANLKLTGLKLPEELNVVGNKSNVAEFGIKLSGIPKKQLAELLAYMEKLQKDGRKPSQMEVALMGQSLATELLRGTPSIKVTSQVGNDKEKAVIIAEAKLVSPDSANDLRSLMWGAINRLVITVSPSFSEALIDEAIASGRIPMTKEEFIQAITEKNRFVLTHGQYAGTFEYKQGRFYSNGQQDNELQSFLLQLKEFSLLGF